MPQPVLTEEKRNAIVAILSVGCPRYVAARYVGCSPTTIARTAARDPQFAARLRQAQASVELAFLRRIGKAADKEQYWRAAAWALERMFPQRYARRDPRDTFDARQVQAALEVLAELLCECLPPAARRELHRRLARAVDQLRREGGSSGRNRSSRTPPKRGRALRTESPTESRTEELPPDESSPDESPSRESPPDESSINESSGDEVSPDESSPAASSRCPAARAEAEDRSP